MRFKDMDSEELKMRLGQLQHELITDMKLINTIVDELLSRGEV